jgi:hypothetical protein
MQVSFVVSFVEKRFAHMSFIPSAGIAAPGVAMEFADAGDVLRMIKEEAGRVDVTEMRCTGEAGQRGLGHGSRCCPPIASMPCMLPPDFILSIPMLIAGLAARVAPGIPGLAALAGAAAVGGAASS